MWVSIIFQLIALLLPYFLEWLESLFQEVAQDLPDPATFGTPEEGVDALFGASMDRLKQRGGTLRERLKLRWAWRVARRNAADVMAARPFAIAQDDAEEIHEIQLAG